MALGAALAPIFALAASGPIPIPTPAAGRPRLVVVVSVDQLRFDYLVRFRPLFQGGFKRILDEGALFTNARFAHATSETGPGHAVLFTGRHARDTGIVANEWYDRLAGDVNVVDDPASRPLPGPAGRGASPVNLLGATIGDHLKRVSPGSRVVGISRKDRSAVLMAGHHGDAAYWFHPEVGRYGSSSYYRAALPAWLEAWNARGRADAFRGAVWTRLLPDLSVYERLAGPDDVPGEWDGRDTVFPHTVRSAPPLPLFYEDLARTPYSDTLTLEVALLALDGHDLGSDEETDVLAVGFSATDSIGHTYGPDSQELMDQVLRVDGLLGRLMDAAESRAGRGRVLFVLSADHGALPLVEVLQGRGVAARRVRPDALAGPVRRALDERFPGAAGLIARFAAPDVYLDLQAIRKQGLRRVDVEAAAREALFGTGLVDRVYTQADLLGDPPADDPDFALFRNSFFQPRSPHLTTRLKPHIYLSSHRGGTGHGTVHDYDRHVPVAFLGPGVRRGAFDAACGPHDIAPTLATALGLDYRLEEGQRVLDEAFPAR